MLHVCTPLRAAARVIPIAILLATALSANLSAKRKDDRLVLTNGDSLTGEIKKLERGELFFKGDYMLSSMQADWRKVREPQSRDEFQVVFANGQRVTGRTLVTPGSTINLGTYAVVLSIDAFCGIPKQAANLVGHAFADSVEHMLVADGHGGA